MLRIVKKGNVVPLVEKECAECGEMMLCPRQRKFCSEQCKKASYKKEPPTEVLVCELCEKKFPWWRKINSKRKRYCSRQCAALSGKGKGRPTAGHDSQLGMRPSDIDRETHCRRKTGHFEMVRCRHYHRWLTETNKFYCECTGFEK